MRTTRASVPCRPPSNCSTSSRSIARLLHAHVRIGNHLRRMLRPAGKPRPRAAGQEIADDDPPRDNGQVRRQAALAAKVPQHRKIIANHAQEDLGAKIIAVLRRKANAARLGRVPDHVQHQTHEAVDEILPCPGLLLQAALQQISVDLRESHALGPLSTNNCPLPLRRCSLLDFRQFQPEYKTQCGRFRHRWGQPIRRHVSPGPQFPNRPRSSHVRQLSYLGFSNFSVSMRVALGLRRPADEFHLGLVGGATALPHVACQTRANDVFPTGRPTPTAGHHVIKAQLVDGKVPAAILALVAVASQDIATIQMDALLRQAIVTQQPDHAGNLDLEIDRADPVFVRLLEMDPFPAGLQPRLEGVVGERPFLPRMNDFCQFPA